MIRSATVDDARTLAELEVRAWRWAYVDIVAEQDMITIDEREAHWSSPGALEGAFVAEVGERVVGVVRVGPDGEDAPAVTGVAQVEPDPDSGLVGWLGVLAVEPAAQGAGLGAALYDHAVGQLQSAGFALAIVWLFDEDGHARSFYERRGWRADGATGTVAEAPALRYRQTLAP